MREIKGNNLRDLRELREVFLAGPRRLFECPKEATLHYPRSPLYRVQPMRAGMSSPLSADPANFDFWTQVVSASDVALHLNMGDRAVKNGLPRPR